MIRIGLISDIHCGKFSRTLEFAVPGEPIQDENKGAVAFKDGLVKILKEMDVEYLFVAGDLTSVASPQEFHYCEEKIVSIADEIGISCEHILCCLGNHDIDRNITKISDNVVEKGTHPDVETVIREGYNLIAANCATSNLKKILGSQEKKGPIACTTVYEEERFIVFVLNSGWLCTHDQSYPHGKLGESQLKWFEQLTDEYKDDGRKKVVLMHHHPFSYSYPIPTQDISMLEEGSELMDIANKSGIDIIIHGHRHHPIAKTIQIDSGTKPITLICVGSLSVNSEHRNSGEIPNTMHILEINETKPTTILYNYKYTGTAGWEKMKFCDVTPLDYKMKLGLIFTKEEIEDAIQKLPLDTQKIVTWESLDECLQYLTYSELNGKIKKVLSEKYKIIGEFPEDVVFIDK